MCEVQNGYWHDELTEESSLLTFATSAGCYRWKWLPLELLSAAEIFQAKMDDAIAGLRGVSTIVDDRIMWGEEETMAEAEEDDDKKTQPSFINVENKG